MRTPHLYKTILYELFSISGIIWSILLAVMYLFLTDILLNLRLVGASISNHFPFATIFSLFVSLFIGSFTSLSAEPVTLYVLLLNAFLVGLNLFLLSKALRGLQISRKVHISLGGATLFSLVTAGCASCGLSLLSVIGLSATLAFLPFHGAELRIISLGLLALSAFYMLKKLHEAKYCRI